MYWKYILGYATNSRDRSKSSGGKGDQEYLVPLLPSYKNKMAIEGGRMDFMFSSHHQLHWFRQIRHVQQKST